MNKRIPRCAATDVEPNGGIRDIATVEGLQRVYGHADCGVYARVRRGDTVRPGDRLETL